MRQMPLYSAAVLFFSNAALNALIVVMPVLYTNRRHEGRNYNHFQLYFYAVVCLLFIRIQF